MSLPKPQSALLFSNYIGNTEEQTNIKTSPVFDENSVINLYQIICGAYYDFSNDPITEKDVFFKDLVKVLKMENANKIVIDMELQKKNNKKGYDKLYYILENYIHKNIDYVNIFFDRIDELEKNERKLQEIKSLLFEYFSDGKILKEELKKLRQEEVITGENLQKKYGDGTINLEKGEFIST